MRTTIFKGFLVVFLLGITGFGLYKLREHQHHFLQRESDYYRPDPQAGHIHQPFVHRVVRWNEHPTGEIRMITNNLGFREDRDTRIEKPANTLRILATGDSHTDGVVNNHESFINRLEEKLNRDPAALSFEVINGGTGYYTFQHYQGFLEKWSSLQPDVYIVTVFTGNDFIEAVKEDTRNYQVMRSLKRFYNRMWLRWQAPPSGLSQGLAQLVYFRSFPEMRDAAVSIATSRLSAIGELCRKQGISLWVVLLPAKFDVDPMADLDQIMDALDLSEEEMQGNRHLASQLKQALERMNIPAIDPYDRMKAETRPLYWNADHHLSDAGHALVANQVYDMIAPIIGKSFDVDRGSSE